MSHDILIPEWLLRLRNDEPKWAALSTRALARAQQKARIVPEREIKPAIAILTYSRMAAMVSSGATSIDWYATPGRRSGGTALSIASRIGASAKQVNRVINDLLDHRLLEQDEDGVRLRFRAHESMQCQESPGSRICPRGQWKNCCYYLPGDVAARDELSANSKILYALYRRSERQRDKRCTKSADTLAWDLGVAPTTIPKLRLPLERAGLVWVHSQLHQPTWVWTDFVAYEAWLHEDERPVQDISAGWLRTFRLPALDISAVWLRTKRLRKI